MKSLSELQQECERYGLDVGNAERPSRSPYLVALREHLWRRDHPGKALPVQLMPMLLQNWDDLAPNDAESLSADHHLWCAQPKLDGVRVLLHVESGRVRLTGRRLSDVTYRLTEHQANVPHLAAGLDGEAGTILDGELVCPRASIDTGSGMTASPLQATMAILTTSPSNARDIQDRNDCRLAFHAFDLLQMRGRDLTGHSLSLRLDVLGKLHAELAHPFIELVPTAIVGKPAVHRQVVFSGGEGTVWKQLDQPYEPGRRVRHWLKRKSGLEFMAFVSGFKPGSPNRGNRDSIGALEFSIVKDDGATRPIAWVTNLTAADRDAMTERNEDGVVRLRSRYLFRRALIVGQDISAGSQRLRHARLKRWLDDTDARIRPGDGVEVRRISRGTPRCGE